MSANRLRNYLGEQLIERNYITREQLEAAIEKQRKLEKEGTAEKLGSILVDMGYCTEENIAEILAIRDGARFTTLNDFPINMSAANLISPAIAKRYKALPIGFTDDNKHLYVAMQNPNDIIAIDDLKIMTGYDIKPMVLPDKELQLTIEQFEQMSTGKEGMEKIEDETEEPDEQPVDEKEDSQDRPAVLAANQILNYAIKSSASDIHVEPMEKKVRIRYRIDGVLHEVMQQPNHIKNALLSRLKVMANVDIAEKRVPQDGRITKKFDQTVMDIRVATLPTPYGEKITLRLMERSPKIITLEELGFRDKQLEGYQRVVRYPYGFILITGPTGSGKSTTLYATLQQINREDRNIITLEDPIERRMEGINQIQTNERAGLTFARGLRSILRSDPDVIMVGEIRDYDTAKIAVESALTGHLVFSTLHTNDSSSAVTRLSEMGVPPYLTASALAGVIAQRLARRLCKACKKEVTMTADEITTHLPGFPADGQKSFVIYEPVGCIQCNYTGYKGRVGIYEYLHISDEIRSMILQNASTYDLAKAAVKEGMVTLRADGMAKIKQGITTIEEFFRVVV